MPHDTGPSRSPTTLLTLLTLTALSTAATAHAEEPRYGDIPPPPPPAATADHAERAKDAKPPPVAFDVAVVTEAPIMIGGQATVELPYRFLVQAELGALPGFYVDAVNGALTNAGAYNDNVSSLVGSGIRNSFVMRLSGGWRPFADHGFEILGGYTLVSLGGGVSARAAIEAASGAQLPSSVPDADILLHTTIHAFHVALGWQWVIADHFLIRTSIGYMQAVASSSSVEVPAASALGTAVAAQVQQVSTAVDSTLDAAYKTYVKLPTLGLGLGYRF